jgi:CO/xanthine dehydrogenase FAD-binding subunit
MNNDELLIAIKDMFEKKVDEVKQHTELLTEKLQCDIKAIAGGHSILDRKVDNLQSELAGTKQELKVDINGLKKDMTIVKDYIIGVDARLNDHEVALKRAK